MSLKLYFGAALAGAMIGWGIGTAQASQEQWGDVEQYVAIHNHCHTTVTEELTLPDEASKNAAYYICVGETYNRIAAVYIDEVRANQEICE